VTTLFLFLTRTLYSQVRYGTISYPQTDEFEVKMDDENAYAEIRKGKRQAQKDDEAAASKLNVVVNGTSKKYHEPRKTF